MKRFFCCLSIMTCAVQLGYAKCESNNASSYSDVISSTSAADDAAMAAAEAEAAAQSATQMTFDGEGEELFTPMMSWADDQALDQTFDPKHIMHKTIERLDVSHLVNIFYPEQKIDTPKNLNFSALQLQEFETIALPRQSVCSDSVEREQYVVHMQPVLQYENSQKQQRYLVPLEFFKVQEDYATPESMQLHLLIFEKLPHNGYRLISRTHPKDKSFDLNQHKLDMRLTMYEQMAKNIQNIGIHQKGSYFDGVTTYLGAKQGDWYVIALNENDYVRIYKLLSSQEASSEIEATVLGQFFYDSKLSFDDTSTDRFFPIIIEYKGTKPDQHRNKIIPVNNKETLYYQPNKKFYDFSEQRKHALLADFDVQ